MDGLERNQDPSWGQANANRFADMQRGTADFDTTPHSADEDTLVGHYPDEPKLSGSNGHNTEMPVLNADNEAFGQFLGNLDLS